MGATSDEPSPEVDAPVPVASAEHGLHPTETGSWESVPAPEAHDLERMTAVERLGFRRAVARFIDFEIIAEPYRLAMSIMRPAHASSHYVSPGIAAVFLLGPVVACGYESGLIARYGWTLGKRLCGVVVVDTHDRPPSGWASVKRWLIVAGIPLFLGTWVQGFLSVAAAGWWLAIGLSILLSADGRGIHDRWAGTSVQRFVRRPRVQREAF